MAIALPPRPRLPLPLPPRPIRAACAFHALLILAACGTADPASNATDNSDTALADADPANDPVLRGALRDQIMVDPALTRQANVDAVRPPPQPVEGGVPPEPAAPPPAQAQADASLPQAPAPSPDCPQCAAARRALTLGALAAQQGGRAAGCAERIGYSAVWSTRLPAALPLYPDARVSEAAGTDAPGCRLRIVSFASAAPLSRIVDYYYARGRAAGFSPGHSADGGEHVVAGTRPGAAFLVFLKPRAGGGTDAHLIVDGG